MLSVSDSTEDGSSGSSDVSSDSSESELVLVVVEGIVYSPA